MEAGRLRHRITVQYKVATRDSFGAEVITWTTLATLYAEIEPLTGREFLEARQTQAENTIRVRIRYYAGIEPEMQISWSGRTFNITSVANKFERKREMELICKEQT